MSNHFVLTHIDGDGLCSAALCIQALCAQGIRRKNITLIFTQPYSINTLLEQLVNEHKASNIHMYILDIAGTESLLPLLQQFKSVVYIDHHSTSYQLGGSCVKLLVDLHRSCSQLVLDYFNLNYSDLVTLGAVCDKVVLVRKSDKIWKEAELLRTALIFNENNTSFRYRLVEQLVAGNLPSEITEVGDHCAATAKRVNYFIRLVKKNIIIDNNLCIVTHTGTVNGRGYGGIVGTKLAIDNFKPVFILYRDSRRDVVVITSRCHRDNLLDLSIVMRNFNGGGHPMAAGGAVYGKYSYEAVADMIVKVVKKQVGV